jgi:hypothetical protein
MRWISMRSEPNILIPTGVRTPVVSMSMRPLTGIVHALLTPGICSARSMRPMSSSYEIRSGHMRRRTAFKNPGAQDEYQR